MRCTTGYDTKQQLVTIPEGETRTLTFRAERGEPYLFERILIGAPTAALAVLQIVRATINREMTVIERVHAKALNRLFTHARLGRPMAIAPENTLEIELENRHDVEATVSLSLIPAALPAAGPAAEMARASMAGAYAQPRLVTVHGTIPANTTAHQVESNPYSVALDVPRFAVASDDEDALRITMLVGDELLRRSQYPQQINDEFRAFSMHAPLRLEARRRLAFDVDNDAGEEQAFSFIAEADLVSARQTARARTPFEAAREAELSQAPTGGVRPPSGSFQDQVALGMEAGALPPYCSPTRRANLTETAPDPFAETAGVRPAGGNTGLEDYFGGVPVERRHNATGAL